MDAESVSCLNFSRERASKRAIEISLPNIFLGRGNFFTRIERDTRVSLIKATRSYTEVAEVSSQRRSNERIEKGIARERERETNDPDRS